MQWKELSALAREMAATPPSDRLHQTKMRLAVSTVYYAMYHALGPQQRRPADWPVRNGGQRAGVEPRLRGPGRRLRI